jgi:phytoene synthase
MTGTDLVRRQASDGSAAASRAVMRQHARSFSWAAIFLPRNRRDDAATVYAFCRFIDDLADEATDKDSAIDALEDVRAQLKGEKEISDAIVEAYLDVVDKRGIPADAALHLIEGVISDFGTVRMESDRDLLRYCYRVAGTVGLMMSPILGVSDERAKPHAIDLGIAMQLTNICRDVDEDGDRNRCYIPASRLNEYGVSQGAVIAGDADKRVVKRVVFDLLQLAERYYKSADNGMRFIPFRSRVAIVVASRVYRSIGKKLAKWGYDPFAGRAVVGWFGKAYWVIRALIASCTAKIRGKSSYLPHKQWLHRRLGGLPGTNAFQEQRLLEDDSQASSENTTDVHSPATA